MMFKTHDMNLSSTLIALGFSMSDLEKKPTEYGTKCFFCFEDSDELKEACQKFWDKELRLEPDLLLDANRKLKIRMYAA